jgi:hypothetical protein
MQGSVLASALCAGLVSVCLSAQAEERTYHDCVQDCRDTLPPGVTLQQCINDRNCAQYPRPHRTYEECLRRCEAEAKAGRQTLQQCIARYVCSQYPPE